MLDLVLKNLNALDSVLVNLGLLLDAVPDEDVGDHKDGKAGVVERNSEAEVSMCIQT